MSLLEIHEPGETPLPHAGEASLAVGIDLGTTNSVVAIAREGRPAAWKMQSRRPNFATVAAMAGRAGHVIELGAGTGAAVIPAALACAAEGANSATTVDGSLAAAVALGVRVAAARDDANKTNTVSCQSGRWSGYAAASAAGRLRRTPLLNLVQAFAIAVLWGGLSSETATPALIVKKAPDT